MNKQARIALAVVVGAAVIYWARNRLSNDATVSVRGVTESTVGGNVGGNKKSKKTVTTTPIKTAAVIAPNSTLDALGSAVGGGTNGNAPSMVNKVGANSRTIPFGSPTLARAAIRSPLVTPASNYRGSTYVPIDATYLNPTRI